MSTKISDLTGLTPRLAKDDLLVIVDTSAVITKSIAADQSGFYSRTNIVTGNVLTLNGTPVQLAPVPGASEIIVPSGILFSLTWNSIAYTTNLNLALIYDTGTLFLTGDSTTLAKTADHIAYYPITADPSGGIIQTKKLSLTVQTGNPAAGNSDLMVYLFYQRITL